MLPSSDLAIILSALLVVLHHPICEMEALRDSETPFELQIPHANFHSLLHSISIAFADKSDFHLNLCTIRPTDSAL
nr:hypothetical protein CFP56_70402 [Quercus suber]